MMNETITLSEPELPQLRQMVLENTRRISSNEQMIDQMRKKESEEERKRRERDEFWENAQRKQELSYLQSCERMDRLEKFAEACRIEHERSSQELREMFKKTDMQLAESKRQIEKTSKQIEETGRQIKETDRRLQETDRLIKETKKQVEETTRTVKEMSIQFMGRTGHIVEGLLSSSAEKVFQEAGLDLHNHGKNLRRKLKAENKQMEVDVLLSNDEVAVPIEVKTNCTREDVRRILHQMELFRDLFPEYADKEVIAAVAAINYENGVDDLARDEGLLVIRVNSDDIFSLDSFDKEALRRF